MKTTHPIVDRHHYGVQVRVLKDEGANVSEAVSLLLRTKLADEPTDYTLEARVAVELGRALVSAGQTILDARRADRK